jgi:hypothetical protein
LLPKTAQPPTAASKTAADNKPGELLRTKPTDQMIKSLKARLPDLAGKLDLTRLYSLNKEAKGGGISGIKIPKAGLRAAVLLTSPTKANAYDTFSVVQEEDGKLVGGSTYVIVASKA